MITLTKSKMIIILLLIGALLLISTIAFEWHSLASFYRMQPKQSCSSDEVLPPRRERLRRYAIGNFYVSGLMDTTGYSHVSRSIRFHGLVADFIVAKLLSNAKLEDFFSKTPCSFRRR